MSENDERLWAALAHASFLLNFMTGILGVAAALVIYLAQRPPRHVAFHRCRFIFQLIGWVSAS
jgi:hypothetical protein